MNNITYINRLFCLFVLLCIFSANLIVARNAIGDTFNTSRDIIKPTLTSPPSKGETIQNLITGALVSRVTDISDSGIDQPGLLVVYSRYSPTNSSGEYFLAFGENSTTCWVYRVSDNSVVAKLFYDNDPNHTIGELHEIRWDYSGDHPNRIYFVQEMKFYQMDITNQHQTRIILHDFSQEIPEGIQIINDVEGDSSNSSRFWAWMVRGPYDGSNYPILKIITYDKLEDQIIGILNPNNVGYTDFLPRPNMVEISPRGTKIITHYGRCWGDVSYGARPQDIGTYIDGPHAWNLDFKGTPIKVSVDETHSGWSYDASGNEMFISQNNRTDWTEAVNINTGEAINIISHPGMGWNNGFHYGKIYSDRYRGWIFINTYALTDENWANNQLFMVELKKSTDSPVIWRIAPNYNDYSGNYRDEAPAGLSFDCKSIYWGANWGGTLGHREVFKLDLHNDWHVQLSPELQNEVVAHAGSYKKVALSKEVNLDASLSTSSGQPITSYIWKNRGEIIGNGKNISVTLDQGIHVVLLEVSNGNFTDIDEVVVYVYGLVAKPVAPSNLRIESN